MTHKAAEVIGPSQWTLRERELLAVTMRLLQKHGYCGLTLDAVAATARASKTTVYRRWPSKAELVLAALIEGVRQIAAVPETGSLRGDLLKLGEIICQEASTRKYHASGAGRGVARSRPTTLCSSNNCSNKTKIIGSGWMGERPFCGPGWHRSVQAWACGVSTSSALVPASAPSV